jgi:outer membrane receptor protein involved in Fe transport
MASLGWFRGVALAGWLSCCLAAGNARAQGAAPANPAEPAERGAQGDELVEQVLDMQSLSQLSLEQLLDLPVVTASGKAEERSLAAANVYIISRADIDRHGYRSLGEMLRRVPGMYLVYDYVNYSVGVREVTGGYRGGTRIVRVMVDGFPINFRPDFEVFLGPEFIPIEAIERVEIAKGPLSALYGANAFLATVNVITREPEEREAEISQRVRVTNGNPGWGTSASAAYSDIDASLLLTVSTDRSDRSGAQARRTYAFQDLTSPALTQPTADDTAAPFCFFGRFDYHTDHAGDFRLEGGHQELNSKAEFQLNSLVTHRSRVHLVNDWLVLGWERKISKINLRATLGGSRGEPARDYELFLTGNPNQSYRPRFDYEAVNGLVEGGYEFGPWLKAEVGVDGELGRQQVLFYRQRFYDEAGYRAFDERDLLTPGSQRHRDQQQFAAYAQAHSTPFEALPDFRLTAAARSDWIKLGSVSYGAQASYRGAVAYRVSPLLTAKLIGGRAFQTPSATLLYAHGGFGNSENVLGTERLDNPRGLRPQVVTSAELVATSNVGDFLSLEGSVFYQELDDAIRFTQAGQLYVAKNSGHVTSAGAELDLRVHFGRFRPYAALSTSRQLSSELTRDLADLNRFSGSPSMFPRLFGYAGCDVELITTKLFLNAELWWAGRRGASQANFYRNDLRLYSLPPYHVLDVALTTGDLPLLSPELKTRLSISAQNVLGEDYMEPGFAGVDIPQPGTTALFQISQTL